MQVTQKPFVLYNLTAEMIAPHWPKSGVHLDLEELEDQKRLDVWRCLVERDLIKLRQLELDFDARDKSLPDWEKRSMRTLDEVWSVLALPEKAIDAGRKRVFGAIPPVDEHDTWVYSWNELRFLAAAFWDFSELRFEYQTKVKNAQVNHDRRTRAAALLRDLQNEL